VNPAFQPTALLGSDHSAGQSAEPHGLIRILQATGVILAVFAVALAAVAVIARPDDSRLVYLALASAVLGLGMLRGAVWAERRWAAEQGLLDAATGLFNRQGLCRAGELLLRQARQQGRPASLIILDFSDLQEVRSIYGREISRKVHAKVVAKMKAIAGPRGLAARTGKGQFSILVPGAGREQAQATVQRLLGKPSRIEFEAGHSEIVLVPDLLCEMAAPDVETVDELYCEVARGLAEMRAREQRRQHYLQRERERHSRPMSLPPSGY
jgi:diguanylate cyclase (GGDEF)-like protein